MKLLVLPPHRDVTCVPEAPEGWRVLDVARAFCQRVLAPETLARAVETREHEPATPQTMRELMLLRAALVLWKRGSADAHRPLRALGAALTALSGPPSGVYLRLDDIELDGGTTERSADVARIVQRSALYDEDLARAAEHFPGAERVRLWLEKDLQLPAAVALAAACPSSVPLEVAGPFAATHRAVLTALPAFQRASFPEDVAPLRWRVVAVDAAEPELLTWVSEGARPPADGGPGRAMCRWGCCSTPRPSWRAVAVRRWWASARWMRAECWAVTGGVCRWSIWPRRWSICAPRVHGWWRSGGSGLPAWMRPRTSGPSRCSANGPCSTGFRE